jgi:hypothetical protein
MSTEQVVRVLVDQAGLAPSAAEFAEMVADYPEYRAKIDALYAVPMVKEEEPQLIFSPLV